MSLSVAGEECQNWERGVSKFFSVCKTKIKTGEILRRKSLSVLSFKCREGSDFYKQNYSIFMIFYNIFPPGKKNKI